MRMPTQSEAQRASRATHDVAPPRINDRLTPCGQTRPRLCLRLFGLHPDQTNR